MTDGIPKVRSIGNRVNRSTRPAPYRKLILSCIVLISALTLNACEAKNPEMVTGLSVHVLNYSQDSITSVIVNGVKIGRGIHAAKIGGVAGGGIACCSGEISAIKKTAQVTIETVAFVNGKSGEVAYKTYTTLAEVELPFPDIMDTLMVHILPGHKVVLEVVPGSTRPRQDLMDAQIKALGLVKEETDSSYMRAERPKYTGYYKAN